MFPKTLEDSFATVFGSQDNEIAQSILKAYEIDVSATQNTPESTKAILNFGGDITFFLPAVCWANAWPRLSGGDSFLYHFNCPNPWDGPWKGHATHDHDLMLLLQNYKEFLFAGQRKCAEKFAEDIIKFVHGSIPWAPIEPTKPRGAMVYYASATGESDESKICSHTTIDQAKRREFLVNLDKEEYLDKLLETWALFMRGPVR